MLKKMLSVLLALLMVMSLSACKLTVADEEQDAAQVVATVNGVEITKGEILQVYNAYRYYYNLTDENEDTPVFAESRKTLLTSVYNTMIEYQLIMQYGGELTSTELTDEMKQTIEEEIQVIIDTVEGGADSVADELLEKDPGLDREAAIAGRIQERLDYRGITNGDYQKTREYEAVISAVREALSAEYEPSDKAIEDYYDTYVGVQQTYLEGDLSYYDQYASESLNLYMPAGFHFVKNLLISVPEEAFNEINALRAEEKHEEADALRDAELAKLEDKAVGIYNRIRNGESFEELLAEFGEDPGMMPGAANAETGYRIYSGNTTYDPNFVVGGMALQKEGDVSKPIASDFGFYIIKLESVSEAHAFPLEEVREGIREVLIESKSSEYYQEIYENWKRDAEIVEYKEVLFED